SPPAGGSCRRLYRTDHLVAGSRADKVTRTFKTKWPSLRLSTPPPTQCTRNASRMMARITTTTQKKNTMMPGMAYPATVLALATATSYPPPPDLFAGCLPETTTLGSRPGGAVGCAPAHAGRPATTTEFWPERANNDLLAGRSERRSMPSVDRAMLAAAFKSCRTDSVTG